MCPAPLDQPSPARDECIACPAHTLYDKLLLRCRRCPPGTRLNTTNASCTPCAVGEFGTGGTCALCAPGLYAHANRTSCHACNGSQIGVRGVCVECAAGSLPRHNATACDLCVAGRYGTDGATCKGCALGFRPRGGEGEFEGTTPGGRGATRCEACAAGQHSAHGLACKPCEAGQRPVAELNNASLRAAPSLVSPLLLIPGSGVFLGMGFRVVNIRV